MGSEREPDEGEAVRHVQKCTCGNVDRIQGDDPGLDAAAIADAMAYGVVEDGRPYLPIHSLEHQAEALMVLAGRVGGHLGTLLDIASTSITIAVMQHKRLYGEYTNGPAPDYNNEV